MSDPNADPKGHKRTFTCLPAVPLPRPAALTEDEKRQIAEVKIWAEHTWPWGVPDLG